MLKEIFAVISSVAKIAERRDAREDGRNAEKAQYLEQQIKLMRKFQLSEQRSKEVEAAERRKKRYGVQLGE